MNDLVSIITPSYNCEKFIGETIKSVLVQTYTDWELIIVDDCSSDSSVKVIQSYADVDSRIRFFELKQNKGAANARNVALSKVRGEYVAFLDSDDIWFPLKLEKQLSFMIENELSFSCTKYEEVDELGMETGVIIKVRPKSNYEQVLQSCPIGNSTVICHVKLLNGVSVPDIKRNNDFALWLQILKRTPLIYGINIVLTKYRIRDNSISRNKYSMLRYHWILFRKIENLSIIKSLYLMVGWIILKVFRLKEE
ncbi:glycosyltransferase family 2 protein [Saccharicrinis sp. FJH62]|uniref:glycosyltransferase family 2 protein n=1 Tax=Saccharicrinis sp. FJH62 TaxID=3344657 RepID=UPI0035D46B63